MYGWLHETFSSSETKSFYTSHWDKWFEFKQTTRWNRKNRYWVSSELKSEKSDVSISSIIMGADKPELNKKWSEVNYHLKEMCNRKWSEVNYHLKEMCNRKNFFLIDYCKKIKASHVNSSRLHLNRKGARILSSSFTQHISMVFNRQLSGNTSCYNFSESDFEENESSNLKQIKKNCWSVLNSLRKNNLDKLIFAHLNSNSIRNKSNYRRWIKTIFTF